MRFEIDASPFEMTDAIYATWQARWAERAPVHVENPGESEVAAYYTERFAAKTYGALRARQISRMLQQLAQSPMKKPKAAAVAAAAGEHDRAIDMLRRAITAQQIDPKHLVRDPHFQALRKHAQRSKLTGVAAGRR